ncbi:MAG: ABC transporter substrate-binding protein [Sandaracinaceae bacterium]
MRLGARERGTPAGPRLARLAGWLLALGWSVAAAGCPHEGGAQDVSTLPRISTPDADAEADLQAAEDAAAAGPAREAEARYLAFLREHPDDPLRPLALLGLGQVHLARGDVQSAWALFEEASASEDPAVAERGRFYQGLALHLGGRAADAIRLLQPLVGRVTDPEQRVLLLRTLASAAAREGDLGLALSALDELAGAEDLPEPDRIDGRRQIRELVEQAPPAAIQQAYDEFARDRPVWPEIARRALRLAYDEGRMERVMAIVTELRAREGELSPELAELALRAERTEQADPRVVGAIVPLTGRARRIGQQAVRGLMLAAGLPGDAPLPADAPQLVLRDDGGDAERAAEAVEELVSVHRAVAIIGPLTGATARAAAERAQELGVPLISLASDPSVTDAGARVFRLYPGPAEETRSLVSAALRRGARRFAVLHPDRGYGRTMARAFAAQVEAAGARVVATVAYPREATAFGDQVARVAQARPDAVFVPDRGERLALIGPALAAEGLWSRLAGEDPPRGGRAISLLAPSVALEPEAVRPSARYLSGLLVASPFVSDADAAAAAFVAAYGREFSQAPSRYAAYAYDAYRMVRAGVDDAGRGTRQSLAEWLTTSGRSLTVGSSDGLGPDRAPASATSVVELREGTFAPLQEDDDGES